MTPEQFDNYSFSIYSEIKPKGLDWIKVDAVDFERRLICTQRTGWQPIELIENIRN